MTCGQRHRGLVRNANGNTIDNPCGLYCNDADHGLWNEAARSMKAVYVDPMWSTYTAKAQPSESLQSQYAAFGDAVRSLPEPSGWAIPAVQLQRVGKAIAAMELGACLIETLENGLAALGEEYEIADTGRPEPPSSGGGGWLSLVTLGVAAGLGWWIVRKVRR